jgi:hypothetical protein
MVVVTKLNDLMFEVDLAAPKRPAKARIGHRKVSCSLTNEDVLFHRDARALGLVALARQVDVAA